MSLWSKSPRPVATALYAKECIEIPTVALSPFLISGKIFGSYTVTYSAVMKTAVLSFISETYLKLRRNNSLFVETYVREK